MYLFLSALLFFITGWKHLCHGIFLWLAVVTSVKKCVTDSERGVRPERNTYASSAICIASCASSTWSQDDSASAADDKKPVSSTVLQHLCTGDFPASYLSHVAMTSRWGNNLKMALLFTIRDGVIKVALLVIKQCYQRSITMDTELHDGISGSLYHHHNSSTLLVNWIALRGHS